MNISEIMTREVVSAQPNCPLDDAIKLFEAHRFRHLPVIEDSRLVGIVSDRDIALATGWILSNYRATNDNSAPDRVSQVMTRDVHSLPAAAEASDAADLILEHRISALPILEEGVVVGLVSTSDLIRVATDRETSSDWRLREGALVDDWMSRDVKSVSPDTTMLDALDLCKLTGVRHLPVIDDGRLVGMISDRDLRFGLGQEIASDLVAQDEGRMEEVSVPITGLMTPQVTTVELGASLQVAAERMLSGGFSALPVVQGDELIGMLTQTDLLRSCC